MHSDVLVLELCNEPSTIVCIGPKLWDREVYTSNVFSTSILTDPTCIMSNPFSWNIHCVNRTLNLNNNKLKSNNMRKLWGPDSIFSSALKMIVEDLTESWVVLCKGPWWLLKTPGSAQHHRQHYQQTTPDLGQSESVHRQKPQSKLIETIANIPSLTDAKWHQPRLSISMLASFTDA